MNLILDADDERDMPAEDGTRVRHDGNHSARRVSAGRRERPPEDATLDHKLPFGKGGTHTIGNAWIVCEQANSAKGTMTIEEFVALCRDVVAHQTASQTQVA